MTPTSARLDDLRQRLTALRTRFGEIGARAAASAPDVTASVVPAEALVDDLREIAADFDGLRDGIVGELSVFPNTPDPTKLGTLKALEAVLTAMERVEAERTERAVWETARDEALAVLDRVMALVHREDKESPTLAECQASARELYGALDDAPSGDAEQLSAHLRPFVELITLAEGWNQLDDERCAGLQDSITQSFGRALGLAAVRGKLGRLDERVVAPAPSPATAIPAEPAPPPSGVPVPAAPAHRVTPPSQVRVEAPPAAPAPIAAPPATAAPGAGAGRVAPPGSPIVVEIRLSGEQVQVETPEERREREKLLEHLAAESARWWVGARAGWESLVQRGLRPAEAARDTLQRFPYLLSVPLSRSDEFESGRLAEGYAILLQRLEKEEPGFVREALARLNPELMGRAKDETYPLGPELYQYIVAEGRLYKTFPELLHDVLVHVLPEPRLWLQGTITETDEATTIVTRPEQPGGNREDSRTLAEASERFTTHTFSVSTGPFTTRVFSVQAAELAEPIDLDIGLSENGATTDRAWIVVAPMSGKPEAPRRHRAGGTKIEQLGKQHRAVWIAAFNSDPNADKSYDLTIALGRKGSAPPRAEPQAAPSSFGKVSPFSRR